MNYFRWLVKWIIEPVFNVGFHLLWYYSPYNWQFNTFLGYKVKQLPFDLHLYQELIFRLKPNFILQTGVADGGSIMYFASILDLMKMPSDVLVVGVDIQLSDNSKKIDNPRVRLFEGDSTDDNLVAEIRKILPSGGGMVILDSDHSKQHVLKEMHIYKNFVASDSYMIVEDTNVNGHPVKPFFGPGPYEAVKDFMKGNTVFLQDDNLWRRNKISFHQRGWLRKIN